MGAVAEIYAGPLKKALAFARQAIERRNTISVLRMVRFDFGQDDAARVTLRGTDLDIAVSMTIDADHVSEWFSLLLQPAPLADFLQHVGPDAMVRFSVMGDKVRVTAEDCGLTMTPLDDLLAWPWFGEVLTRNECVSHSAQIDPDVLRRALTSTIPAISTEETRYYLNGIFLHKNQLDPEQGFSLCAADGHRLALVNTGLPADLPDAILPRKSAKILNRALAKTGNGAPLDVFSGQVIQGRKARVLDEAGNVTQEEELQLSAPLMTFTGPNWTIATKTIDGTYPDYTRVIPKHDEEHPVTISVTVTAKDLLRLPSFGPAFGPARAVKIDPAAGTMSVDDMDGNTAFVPCQGRGETFGMNRIYLKEFIVPYGSARLESTSYGDPFRVLTDDPNLVQVIMPMRV